MFDSLKEKIKEEYKKQNDLVRSDGQSPEARQANRMGGIVMLVLGFVGLGVNWYCWTRLGYTATLLVAGTVTFLGLGVWVLIIGKMPFKRR